MAGHMTSGMAHGAQWVLSRCGHCPRLLGFNARKPELQMAKGCLALAAHPGSRCCFCCGSGRGLGLTFSLLALTEAWFGFAH